MSTQFTVKVFDNQPGALKVTLVHRKTNKPIAPPHHEVLQPGDTGVFVVYDSQSILVERVEKRTPETEEAREEQ